MIRRPQWRALVLAVSIVLVAAILPGLAGGQLLAPANGLEIVDEGAVAGTGLGDLRSLAPDNPADWGDPCPDHCVKTWNSYGHFFYEGQKQGVVVGGDGHVRLQQPGAVTGSITFTHDAEGVTAQPYEITFAGDVPAGTSVVLEARSSDDGQTYTPDWYTNMSEVPPAHVLQVRATLHSTDPGVTPDISGITVKYDPPDYCWGGSSVYANCYGTGHVETLGGKRMIAIRIKFFDDHKSWDGFNDAWAQGWMTQLNNWLLENSYGQMSLSTRELYPQVLSLPNFVYSTCNYEQIWPLAWEAADPYIDFHNYDYVWFIRRPQPPPEWCPGVGSWGSKWQSLSQDGHVFLASQWNDVAEGMNNGLMHEFVHGLWTSHAGFEGGPSNNCDSWCDVYDVMGSGFVPGTSTPTNAIHKETIGWLKAPRITRVTQNGTFTIEELEVQTSNLKVLKVGPLNKEPFYAELRKRVAGTFDANIPTCCAEGVILHRIVPGVNYGSPMDTKLLNPYYLNLGDDYPIDVVLKPNMPFTDSVTGYTIVLRSSPTTLTATLQVCIPGNFACQIGSRAAGSKARVQGRLIQ